jgi:hypothetical protein
LIAAHKELEVAKLEYDAALFQSDAIILTADGEKDAIKAQNEAEAFVLKNRVSSLGGGDNFARYTLYEKIGPQVLSVLSSDSAEGLGKIFDTFAPSAGGAK